MDAQGKGAAPLSENNAALKTSARRSSRAITASASKVSYVDLTNDDDEIVVHGSKKKLPTSPFKRKVEEDDPTDSASKKKKKTAGPRKKKDEEQRLKAFRKQAPQSYLQKLSRALDQRMFVIDRTPQGTEEVPEEVVEMAGTTGNIYHVTISKLPHCTCPDNMKGNQCKHIVYVLHNVLKAPEHLQYQVAFLSSELREIFSTAPPPPSLIPGGADASPTHPSHRKPIEGDCPICFTTLSPDAEAIVFCKAACGNNIHASCFEQWARSRAGKPVTCVYCRTPWQGDEESIKEVSKKGEVNEEGYVNVGRELGLSAERDHSSYHRPWVRRRFGYS